ADGDPVGPAESGEACDPLVARPRVPPYRLVVGPTPTSIDQVGVVVRYVDHLGRWGLDVLVAVVAVDLHLLAGAQVAGLVGAAAQPLDGVAHELRGRLEGLT